VDFSEEVRRFEADLIRRALTLTGGHQRRAARLLNLKVTTLNALIRRHRIEPRAFKAADDTSFT
jgi:transcriptional regulator with GAF, ATPase, and Fis domain